MPGALRLDVALVERGLVRSRSQAQQRIRDGLVTVNRVVAEKASALVGPSDVLEVAGDEWVSRAAHKLIAALDAFGIDPEGRDALDAGASTGGFTQVLLERGARHVTALDVGHGQFQLDAAALPVTLLEGVNVRDVTCASVQPAPTLVTADLSFISLTLALAPLAGVAAPAADFVVLIKPQFEAGRGGIRDGIVHDREVRAQAVERVLAAAWEVGLGTAGLIRSPLQGTHGNVEFLAHFSAGGGLHPSEWQDEILRAKE